MNLLLDSCVWGGVKQELLREGHDVVWMGDAAQDPGDHEVLAQAVAQRRILITLDKDFGELIFLGKQSHCGVIRLVEIPSREQGAIILRVLATLASELEHKALITANTKRIRVRLPLR